MVGGLDGLWIRNIQVFFEHLGIILPAAYVKDIFIDERQQQIAFLLDGLGILIIQQSLKSVPASGVIDLLWFS